MKTQQKTWIRFAVSKERIYGGDLRHWRCFIGDDVTEIPLRSCQMRGVVSEKNFFTESNPDRDERGLVAWLRCYGNVHIDENDRATIELLDPS